MSDRVKTDLVGNPIPPTERQSLNHPHVMYRPVRSAPRKGAHEALIGHEWVCRTCRTVVHTEPLVGMEEETEEQTRERQLRIRDVVGAHQCEGSEGS